MYRKNPFKSRVSNAIGNFTSNVGTTFSVIASCTLLALFTAGTVGLPILIAIALLKYIFG